MAIVLPKFPRRRLSPQRRLTRRTEPALGLRLLTLQAGLEPLDLFEFEYRIQRVLLDEVERLEISVIWYTEGKGSEDLGVHFFQSVACEELPADFSSRATQITTTLPAGPLSYEGRLLKVRWCVRLRLFLNDGREIASERPFYLGQLAV